jgi:hypothetical protein
VLKVTTEKPEQLEHKVLLENKESKVKLEQLEHKESKGLQDKLVILVILVRLEHKVFKV